MVGPDGPRESGRSQVSKPYSKFNGRELGPAAGEGHDLSCVFSAALAHSPGGVDYGQQREGEGKG